ncbi:hypothetical protein ACQ4PT_008436 [Festuca glaucescens]
MKWAAPSVAGDAADLSSSWGPSRFGSAVESPAKKKRAYETEAQICCHKKKNKKNWERKAAGLKINSPDDVPTFDESDSNDKSEIGQISLDIQEANKTSETDYPDVEEWPIKSYDIPKQTDTNSCGLWVLQCMEHWDGDRMTCPVSQARVDESKESTVANIVFSPTNILEKVKNKKVSGHMEY